MTHALAANGTKLASCVLRSDGSSAVYVGKELVGLVRKVKSDATERDIVNEACVLLFRLGHRLIASSLSNERVDESFNIDEGPRVVEPDAPIASVEVLIPEGKALDGDNVEAQIIPLGAATRMPTQVWNGLVGQAVTDAAFARALSA